MYNCESMIEDFLSHHRTMLLDEKYGFCFIDGGSTDETPVKLGSADYRFDLIINKFDVGIYDAWNVGLNSSSGFDYVTFVGIDDKLIKSYYDKILEDEGLFEKKLVVGKCSVITDDNYYKEKILPSQLGIFGKNVSINWGHQGTLHNSSLFEYARFDVTFKLAGDLELYTRLVKLGQLEKNDVIFIDELQCLTGADGVSRQLQSVKSYETEFARINQLHDVQVVLNFWFHIRKIKVFWPLITLLSRLKKKLYWNKI